MTDELKQRLYEDTGPDFEIFQTLKDAYADLRQRVGRRRAWRYLVIQETCVMASVAAHRNEIALTRTPVGYDHLLYNISDFAIASIRQNGEVMDLFENDDETLERALALTKLVLPSWVVLSATNPARLVPTN